MCGGGASVRARGPWVPWNSLLSYHVGLGLELRSPGLVASPFTCFAISLSHGSLYPSSRGISNFHESLQGRLRHRRIIFPPVSIPSSDRVLRRCRLIAPHPSRPAERLTGLWLVCWSFCTVGGACPHSSVTRSPGCWSQVGSESPGC